MFIYGLKTCDTCRKALKSFPHAVFVDVRGEGVPVEMLKSAHARFGDSLLNRQSKTWRDLSEDARTGTVIELLKQHPTLMKRPLIAHNGELFLGWNEDVQTALRA